MKDIDKELYEKMNLYDKIIGSCMVNTYSTSKDGKIILRDFDKNLDMYMFEFEVAKMVQSIYSDRQIYMDMGLFEYLVFKFKHRKECKLKRIKRKDTDNCELNIEDMLLFVAKAYGFNVDNFSDLYKDIYNLYWKERGKINI